MILAASLPPLVTPDVGLAIWTAVAFLILLFLLTKFAWKPILGVVKERESNIEEALRSAEKAKEEMAALQASNEALLKEAREERDNLLKEARETKDALIAEAKKNAKVEADRVMTQAKEAIENEKKSAMAEIKTQVASLSLEIAEKVLRDQLANDDKQKALVSKLLDDVKMN